MIGAEATPLRDLYHLLLRHRWSVTFAFIAAAFLFANALFATIYVFTGGVAHARPGSFADAFSFSVQTMGTIGYGVMYPETPLANALVAGESIVGLILVALFTGLVFAKFSRPTARIKFSVKATISPMNGVPTLTFRLGNARSNQIVSATVRATFVRTETTTEGKIFYRMLDLKLVRDCMPSLSRAWNPMHVIDADSPLRGATPESLAASEAELMVLVVGLDDTSMQQVHASYRYFAHEIVFGARHADVLTETPDGAMELDLRRFHELEPTVPTQDFPFPRRSDAASPGVEKTA